MFSPMLPFFFFFFMFALIPGSHSQVDNGQPRAHCLKHEVMLNFSLCVSLCTLLNLISPFIFYPQIPILQDSSECLHHDPSSLPCRIHPNYLQAYLTIAVSYLLTGYLPLVGLSFLTVADLFQPLLLESQENSYLLSHP